MDIYTLSRNYWDFAFENPEVIKPSHAALYFFTIEHSNRLGWKKKFGLPTTMAMEALGIKSYNTYINTLHDLVNFGLLEMVQKSTNQYSANIIALSNFNKAHDKALDKALVKHSTKHTTKQSESTVQSIDSIDIPIYNITNLPIYKSTSLQSAQEFEFFWDAYGKKIDKNKCEKAWSKLKEEEIQKIISTVSDYVICHNEIKYRKNPLTYLNGKCWNDELQFNQNQEQGKFEKNLVNIQSAHNAIKSQMKDGKIISPFDWGN